jgi:hypothetical protein
MKRIGSFPVFLHGGGWAVPPVPLQKSVLEIYILYYAYGKKMYIKRETQVGLDTKTYLLTDRAEP